MGVVWVPNPAWEAHLEENIIASAEELGDAIQGDAERFAPVDTGELKASGFHEVDGRNVRIGFTSDHAEYVERGTHNEDGTERMAAQPYLAPAAYRTRNLKNRD